MKKNFAKISLISMVIVLILGFVLIFSSGSIGQYKGEEQFILMVGVLIPLYTKELLKIQQVILELQD